MLEKGNGEQGTGNSRKNLGGLNVRNKGWMYSEGHRHNLLSPQYTKFGYGIVVDHQTGRVFAVQNFR